jgi:hypothetical protein
MSLLLCHCVKVRLPDASWRWLHEWRLDRRGAVARDTPGMEVIYITQKVTIPDITMSAVTSVRLISSTKRSCIGSSSAPYALCAAARCRCLLYLYCILHPSEVDFACSATHAVNHVVFCTSVLTTSSFSYCVPHLLSHTTITHIYIYREGAGRALMWGVYVVLIVVSVFLLRETSSTVTKCGGAAGYAHVLVLLPLAVIVIVLAV